MRRWPSSPAAQPKSLPGRQELMRSYHPPSKAQAQGSRVLLRGGLSHQLVDLGSQFRSADDEQGPLVCRGNRGRTGSEDSRRHLAPHTQWLAQFQNGQCMGFRWSTRDRRGLTGVDILGYIGPYDRPPTGSPAQHIRGQKVGTSFQMGVLPVATERTSKELSLRMGLKVCLVSEETRAVLLWHLSTNLSSCL